MTDNTNDVEQTEIGAKPLPVRGLSLLNDRWRTDTSVVTGSHRSAALRVHHGDYIAEWTQHGKMFHARFRVEPGEGAQHVVLFGASHHRRHRGHRRAR